MSRVELTGCEKVDTGELAIIYITADKEVVNVGGTLVSGS